MKRGTSLETEYPTTPSTTKDHEASTPVHSVSEDIISTKSSTSAVSDTTTQDTLPVIVTQPVNTMPNNSTPLPSASTATADAGPFPSVSSGTIVQVATVSSDNLEMNLKNSVGPQDSASRQNGKDQAVIRKARNSQPIATLQGRTTMRKSERRARRRDVRPLITMPNSKGMFSASVNLRKPNTCAEDPIMVDDDSDSSEPDGSVTDGPDDSGRSIGPVYDRTGDNLSDHVPNASSMKQVLQHRQRHLERLKSSLDHLITYVGSTPDSDQTGDYGSMGMGRKRSFEDFVAAELDDSDQPNIFASKFLDELRKYQGMLRRIKRFDSK